MPATVGILTFIRMINTPSEGLKARNFFICRYFSFYEQLKCRAQLSKGLSIHLYRKTLVELSMQKSFITSGQIPNCHTDVTVFYVILKSCMIEVNYSGRQNMSQLNSP